MAGCSPHLVRCLSKSSHCSFTLCVIPGPICLQRKYQDSTRWGVRTFWTMYELLCISSCYLCTPLVQADTRQGVVCLTNSLDRLPGPPPAQPALTDSTADVLVITKHPCFLKPSDIPQKWLKISFVCVYASARVCIDTVYACMHIGRCTCEGLCVCLRLYVCIVYRSVTKGGRQLGLPRRECAEWGAIRGRGITKGGENGEYSCYPLWPKHFGGQAERKMVKKERTLYWKQLRRGMTTERMKRK